MKTRNKIAIVFIMLSIAVGNYCRMNGTDSIRSVYFVSIFAIGLISGILLKLLIEAYKAR